MDVIDVMYPYPAKTTSSESEAKTSVYHNSVDDNDGNNDNGIKPNDCHTSSLTDIQESEWTVVAKKTYSSINKTTQRSDYHYDNAKLILVNTNREEIIDLSLLTPDQMKVRNLSKVLTEHHSDNHKHCITKPKPTVINENLPEHLNALAGFLTADLIKQKCTVLSLVPTKHPVLLIGNDAVNNSNHIVESMVALKKYFNNPSKEGYKELLNYAIGLVDYKLQNDKMIKKMSNDLFHHKKESTTQIHYNDMNCINWIEFVKHRSAYIKKNLKIKDFVDIVLEPITDCIIIVEAFINGNIDTNLINIIKNYDGNINDETSVKYLKNYMPTMHPDMKILSEIIDMLKKDVVNRDTIECDIGISKLTCFNCNEAFEATVENCNEIFNGKVKLTLNTPGTSGRVIPAFIAPKHVAKYLVDTYKSLLKKYSSTSKNTMEDDVKDNTNTTKSFDIDAYQRGYETLHASSAAEHTDNSLLPLHQYNNDENEYPSLGGATASESQNFIQENCDVALSGISSNDFTNTSAAAQLANHQ